MIPWRLRTLLSRLPGGRMLRVILGLTGAWAVVAGFAGAVPRGPWQEGPGYRRLPLSVPPGARTGFREVSAAETGVVFTNVLTDATLSRNSNLMNGSGVACGDVDGDGWCDLYFCGLESRNALYRNLGGWRFEDVTDRAGVACTNQLSRGAVFADLDGDADLDLLVTVLAGGVRSFANDGRGQFTETTAAAGLASKASGTSLALGDVDGDRDLDLYVANFADISLLRDGGRFSVVMDRGQPKVIGRHAGRLRIVNHELVELGEPDALYLNDGQGRFQMVSWTGGAFLDEDGQPLTSPPQDFGLSVQLRDLNGDGSPDLYVCNDFQTPDRLWLNDGRGRFRAIARLALRTTSYASMGADCADLDRDGHLDCLVVEMLSRQHALRMRQMSTVQTAPPEIGRIDNRPQIPRNTLFWNRGDGTYAEIADFAGLAASEWSWMPAFLDVDLDGYEDVLIPNGHTHDMMDRDATERFRSLSPEQKQARRAILDYPTLETANLAFRNRGDLTFEDVSAKWGFDSRRLAHGLALADLDNDGDLDVIVSLLNAAPLLGRNETAAPRVALRLKGLPGNRQGIGAQVSLAGGPFAQRQEILAGGRYLSGDDPMRVFAVVGPPERLSLEVRWRSGRRSVVENVQSNCLYELDEASAAEAPRPAPPTLRPWFEDASALLGHTHSEAPFDDLARQPLLPRRLSQLGPGLAWTDLDGDGHDDLVIGAGRGGTPAFFRNDGHGGFTRSELPLTAGALPDDTAGVVGWTPTAGERSLLLGLANYETGNPEAPSVLRWGAQPGQRSLGAPVPGNPSSSGPLAVADVDNDGDLDLFVGGRLIAGSYPEPASSQLYRNEGGALTADPESGRLLEKVGLVSGAVFSDLDGDGWPELVLACEWGPIRVFRGANGRFTEITGQLGLDAFVGWWNSVTTGDLDGDGRLDIVAGNWGLNSPYQARPGSPVTLYFGDLDLNGTVDLIEAEPDEASNTVVPRRNLADLGAAMPFVKARFSSHRAYSTAGLEEILGDARARAKVLQAFSLESAVFFNRGATFERQALPREAQWAPAFGLSIADLDGDGAEDVFLGQNFFALPTDAWRQDAGRGLWLRGDGRGGLNAVPGQESGILVYGEQRGSAVGDFNEDGRVDVAVSQNGAATRLYRNAGAKPGLRVRLAGPPGNPTGVGATIRLKHGEQLGPAREIHAGSGYWSQDSAIQVLAAPSAATEIRVRWPGGRVTTSPVEAECRDVVVNTEGSVRRLR